MGQLYHKVLDFVSEEFDKREMLGHECAFRIGPTTRLHLMRERDANGSYMLGTQLSEHDTLFGIRVIRASELQAGIIELEHRSKVVARMEVEELAE